MNLQSMALRWENDQLSVLDQQLLPFEKKWLPVDSVEEMISIIKALKVRGAPLIGVAAALSLADEARREKYPLKEFLQVAERLRGARPTAVNLMNAVDRLVAAARSETGYKAVWDEAVAIFREDVSLCEKMGQAAAQLIDDGDGILTHCNTGGLATAGRGTALAAISYAWEQKKALHVYVDETRPLLQGGRLTAWELSEMGIPHTLICDNMAGYLMARGKVQKVFVGTDRIAMNGDFANKVGTYSVAVLCKHHGIPFYVVGPSTTVDRHCASGRDIPIEERSAAEVRGVEGSFGKIQWASEKSAVYNPAFDVTPVDLVTGIVVDDQLFSQNDLKAGKLAGIFN
jgi:methylthioribose-1-phosphate isomerase